MSQQLFKNFNILEFDDYIWNHDEKCIQISTNMPGIDLVICEKGFEFNEFWEKENTFLAWLNPMATL